MSNNELFNLVVPRIIERFPEFQAVNGNSAYGIADIFCKTPKGKLTFWLTTQEGEVTIGFWGDTLAYDWHTHMELLGAAAPDQELETAITIIDNLLNDRQEICFSTIYGYYINDTSIDVEQQEIEGEAIVKYKWSDL